MRELQTDTAYRVAAGENEILRQGEVFCVGSRDGSLFNASVRGWLEKDEYDKTAFDGLKIEEDQDYEVIVKGRSLQFIHKSRKKRVRTENM